MPIRLTSLLALFLAACTSYADPASIRAPQTERERVEHAAAAKRVEPVMQVLALRNQDVCTLPCRLDIKLGMANGIGAFADRQNVWLPVPMVNEARDANEIALVLAHEWAHVILGDPGGFDEAREMRAECLGTMLAKRAGFDPVRGADLHRRMARREAGEQIIMIAMGMMGGGTSLGWSERVAMIERAAATAADKPAMASVCGVRW